MSDFFRNVDGQQTVIWQNNENLVKEQNASMSIDHKLKMADMTSLECRLNFNCRFHSNFHILQPRKKKTDNILLV